MAFRRMSQWGREAGNFSQLTLTVPPQSCAVVARGALCATAKVNLKLKRIQKVDYLRFLKVTQRVERVPHSGGLSVMPLNGVVIGKRQTVVHQPVASPKSPKWSGTNLGTRARELGTGLNRYAVSRADIVQQEIAEGMDGSVAQSVRNGERTAVDRCAGGGRDNGTNVTNIAAY